MGGKSKPSNNEMVDFEKQQAEEARQKEAERQARLTQGKTAIDQIFTGGGFDDAFYNKYKQAYTGYTQPQIDDQYTQAKKKMTFDLARAGLLRSTNAGEAQGNLEKQYINQLGAMGASADQQVATLRQNIAGQENAALSQLYATEDPNVAANTALQSVQQAQLSTPNLQPLGELFKPLVIGGAAALTSAANQNLGNSLYTRSPNQSSYANTIV